jgi:hypothetical protein
MKAQAAAANAKSQIAKSEARDPSGGHSLPLYWRNRRADRRRLFGLVRAWPGPFNAMQVLEAMLAKTSFRTTIATILQSLYRLERKGVILRTHQGRGRVGNIWELAVKQPDELAKRRNRQADYESGFRHIVRAALADDAFPKEFTLADLKGWMAIHMPHVQVPYGSWSSTLYKLQQAGELRVVKAAHTVPLKVYGRGERVVMPSGEELDGIEKAWLQFKEEFPRTEPGATQDWSQPGSILERGAAA